MESIRIQATPPASMPAGEIRLDKWTAIGLSRVTETKALLMVPESLFQVDDLEEAIAYAKAAADFFRHNGVNQTMFVLKPPAWVAKSKYEVTTNTCGYAVIFSTDLSVDLHLSVTQQRDILLDAMKALLQNQVDAWEASGFSEEQIRKMPYLKPGFRAVDLASR